MLEQTVYGLEQGLDFRMAYSPESGKIGLVAGLKSNFGLGYFKSDVWPPNVVNVKPINVNKLQFIHTVDGDESKTAIIIKRQC